MKENAKKVGRVEEEVAALRRIKEYWSTRNLEKYYTWGAHEHGSNGHYISGIYRISNSYEEAKTESCKFGTRSVFLLPPLGQGWTLGKNSTALIASEHIRLPVTLIVEGKKQ